MNRSSRNLILLLTITISLAPSFFSQIGGKAQSPVRPSEIPAAVNELLQQQPLGWELARADVIKEEDEASPSIVEEKPPANDAPIQDLIEYWTHRKGWNASADIPKPSEVVRERLLTAAENRPWLLPALYGFLPENTDTHDRLYKLYASDPEEFDDNDWRGSLYWWLQANTQYLRKELTEAVRTRDNNDADKLDEMEALAKLDWFTAKPLLENIAAGSISVSTPMAASLLYEEAVKRNETAQIETYRAILKKVVGEKALSLNSRRTALKSLLKDEWIGQEEWYCSLFSNSTLWGLQDLQRTARMNNLMITGGGKLTHISSTTSVFYSMNGKRNFLPKPDLNYLSIALNLNPAKWIPVVTKVLNHDDPTVRDAAVSSLNEFIRNQKAEKKDCENAAQALLPWLRNPDWVSVPGRADFIIRLSEIDLPESVSDLFWVLEHDKGAENRDVAV